LTAVRDSLKLNCMKSTNSIKAWTWLSRTYRLIQANNRREFRGYGLSASQFEIIVFLGTAGPSSQNALTRHLQVTKGNISSMLKGLERRGLIKRKTPKEDRRLNLVCLTDSGREIFTEALPKHEKKLTSALSSITAKEKKNLVRILQKLHSSLGGENQENAPFTSHVLQEEILPE